MEFGQQGFQIVHDALLKLVCIGIGQSPQPEAILIVRTFLLFLQQPSFFIDSSLHSFNADAIHTSQQQAHQP